MKFHFSVFNYDTEQKILKQGTQTIELTKKNHTLLTFLLNNPNKLISREELIDHVWQGRVVTNNTIDQCILKLRKTLNHVREDEYIETVYGQGIRFIPTIESQHQETTDVVSKSNNQKVWLGLLFSVLLLFVAYSLLSQQDSNTIDALNSTKTSQPISPTVLSKQSSDEDWMLDGSRSYLGYLLHLYPNIELQNIKKNKATEDNKPNLVLELTRADQSKLLIQVDLYQQAQTNEINDYHADINSVNGNENFTGIQLTDNQLTVLLPKVADWVAQLDDAETPQQIIDPNIFTQNEQALLNYFRGLVVQITGNSELALEYFNTAVDLDPGFKVAWYELAIATSKQGDPKKAISVLNSIDSNDQWLTYRAEIAKAITYAVLKDSDAAIKSYANALKIAEDSNDKFKMTVVYTNQAILYSNMELYDLAEQQLLLAIEHTDMESDPNLYGSIMHSYARIAIKMNNLPLAIEKSQIAIEAYQISGDVRYEMQAKTRLAGLLLDNNEFNPAELLVKESLSYATQLNNRNAVSDNRTKLAIIFQNTGRIDLAIEQWQAVIALNTELNNSASNAEAYYWLMKLHLATNNTNQAEMVLNLMQQLVHEHPKSDHESALAEVNLMLALYQHDSQKAQLLIAQMTSIPSEKRLVYQGDLARSMGDDSMAETHYLNAAEILNQQGIPYHLTEALNRLNDLYLNYETSKLDDSLDRTSRLKPFIYPYQKYQAQAAKVAGNHIEALSLMEELKLKAGDFWQPDDQTLLDGMKNSQL